MLRRWSDLYLQPNMLALAALGFSSGLPLALTLSTLTAWLSKAGVDKHSIGLFASVGTPYALKFLWSPLIDGTRFPVLCRLLGQRRGWLLATQAALIASLALLGLSDPAHDPWLTAAMAVLVAFCSASQDIVIDAYRVELLTPEEQGAGAGATVLGYRIGMITSSAGALWLADEMGWRTSYFCMAALIAVGVIAPWFAGEPQAADGKPWAAGKKGINRWLHDSVIMPFADFMKRDAWLMILLFIVLYKLGDAFMGIMTNPFLLDTGFTLKQIVRYVKIYGFVATVIGSLIGGAMTARIGVVKSLYLCGILHALTNLMFVALARAGADTNLLALSIALENVTGGMSTSAFIAFASSLCNRHFTATQYALLSSLAALDRTWLSTPAGWCAETLGWPGFFLFSAALSAPGLLVLWRLSHRIRLEEG